MDQLKAWLESYDIEVLSEDLTPEGMSQLELLLPDGSTMEIALAHDFVEEQPEASIAFVEQLILRREIV